VTNDVDTLATALYVKTDDLLKQYPDLAPWRPRTGLQPRLSDAELVTLAVMQALLGYTSEAQLLTRTRLRSGQSFGVGTCWVALCLKSGRSAVRPRP
jgi:hypothetical protein